MTGEQKGQHTGRIKRLKQKGTLFNYQYKEQKAAGIREFKLHAVIRQTPNVRSKLRMSQNRK